MPSALLPAAARPRGRTALAVALTGAAVAGALQLPAAPAQAGPTPIVGGSFVPNGTYAFTVSLQDVSEPGNAFAKHFCGGSLISPTWVLTAAHCVRNTLRPGTALPTDVDLVIGRTTLSGTGGQLRDAAEIRVHPSYNASTHENDVALIRLATASTVTRVQLATSQERDLWDAGDNVVTVGWGATAEGGAGSDTLRQVAVPVVADSTMASSTVYGTAFKPRSMLGAGPLSGGRDSCQGDSGGPLFAPSASPSARPRQIGVVSWGEGCAGSTSPASTPASAPTSSSSGCGRRSRRPATPGRAASAATSTVTAATIS